MAWIESGCVAQVVEHLTFNQVVRGSNPRTLSLESYGYADVAELADALDLGSSSSECRFDSCHPHWKTHVNAWVFYFCVAFVLHNFEKWSLIF